MFPGLKCYPRYELAAVLLEPRGPFTDCTITPSLTEQLTQSALHSPLASTHTHSLPLSLASSSGDSPCTLPLVKPCAHSHFGDVTQLFYFILFRTRARAPSPQYNAIDCLVPFALGKQPEGAQHRIDFRNH